jgi:CheY-like chemotaxis protein
MFRVLVVDDEPAILDLFFYVFEEAGYVVSVAKNGREALAAVAANAPDFIVLDVSMPEMSGKEFALELKRLGMRDDNLKRIRFVVMTGENFMDAGLNSAFASVPGFSGFFPKMTPPERVLERAAQLLGKGGA